MKNYKYIHWLILGLSCLIFLPAVKAGLVTDFTGFSERIMLYPDESILKKYGYYSIQWVTSLMMYIPYVLWELHRDLWGVYFITLHAINGILLYELAKLFLQRWSISHSSSIALGAAFIFLLHPYQVEPVIWKACISYLLCVGLMSTSLILFLKKRNYWYLGWSCFVFLLSLMTIELAFTLPFIIFTLVCCLEESEDWIDTVWKGVTRSLPHLSVLLFYLIWNKWSEGEFVGHYGARVHLSGNPIDMLSTISKYFYKDLLFIRHWPHPLKESVFQFLSGWMGILCLMVPLAVTLLFSKRKKRPFVIFLSFGFGLALLPISNLFFSFLLFGENDRYGYWGLFFFALLLSYLLFKMGKKWGWLFLGLYLVVATFFTWNTIQDWRSSEISRKSLVNNFPMEVDKPVILLNIPDNYNGLYMFRRYGNQSGMYHALKYIEKRKNVPEIIEVYQYNMTDIQNGCKAEMEDTRRTRVEFSQWGNWYWNDGIGGVNVDNKWYSTKIDGHVYRVDWKINPDDYAIFVQNGTQWERVN